MLRKLEMKDMKFMLEWMHDANVSDKFIVNFGDYSQCRVEEFIRNSFTEENQHFAVVDDLDEYQGTISLKNISYQDLNAEYAVVFRSKALGKGVSTSATKEILQYAFEELKLEKVYLNVLEKNERARRFYEKVGFELEGKFLKHKFIRNEFHNLYWYAKYKNK